MDDWVLDARVDQIRSFVSVLGALKLSKRQLVHVSVAERGMTVVAQDPSKSLQAQVNFRAETFPSYRVNASAAGTQGHGGTRGGGTQGPGSYVVPVTFVAYAEVEIDEDEGYDEPL